MSQSPYLSRENFNGGLNPLRDVLSCFHADLSLNMRFTTKLKRAKIDPHKMSYRMMYSRLDLACTVGLKSLSKLGGR